MQLTPQSHGSHQSLPPHPLNFRWIIETVGTLDDTKIYLFLEFDIRWASYASRELSGRYIKENIKNLAFHTSHSYRILEKKSLSSPVTIDIWHRVPDRVERILH